MNTLEHNRYTEAWRTFGATAPRPRAILCVSAHWYINATAVTAMAQPRVIHDFYGFPRELFEFDYPAPGAPDVAAEVVEACDPMWVGLDHDSWGLDHGTWSVLAHVYPEADVPVVQMSINALQDPEYHLELGRRLAPLREQGVMVVASGNVVHNLGRIDWSSPDTGFDWAQRFDEEVRGIMASGPGSLPTVLGHPDFATAVPTPDHFVPLMYLAGMADAAGEGTEVLIDGYTYGSLSMTCYRLGGDGGGTGPTEGESDEGAAELPDPAWVPPVETNT